MVFAEVTSWVDIFSDILAICIFCATLIVPVFSFIYIRKIYKSNSLTQTEIIEKYGELYVANLNIFPNMKRLAYNVLFMLRRVLTSFCMLYLTAIPNL